MKTVVYLGNMWEYPEAITRIPGARLEALVYEEGEDPDPALRIARRTGARACRVRTAGDIEEAFREVGPFDIGIIANFGLILSARSLTFARDRFINFHPGLLPEQAGRSPVQRIWGQGGGASGLTVHIATEKSDTGPPLRVVPYTVRSDAPLNRNILQIYHLGLSLLPELI